MLLRGRATGKVTAARVPGRSEQAWGKELGTGTVTDHSSLPGAPLEPASQPATIAE